LPRRMRGFSRASDCVARRIAEKIGAPDLVETARQLERHASDLEDPIKREEL